MQSNVFKITSSYMYLTSTILSLYDLLSHRFDVSLNPWLIQQHSFLYSSLQPQYNLPVWCTSVSGAYYPNISRKYDIYSVTQCDIPAECSSLCSGRGAYKGWRCVCHPRWKGPECNLRLVRELGGFGGALESDRRSLSKTFRFSPRGPKNKSLPQKDCVR